MGSPVPDRSPHRILIVDDSPDNVRLLARILKRGGYDRISGISDPRLVLGQVLKDPPDLVIVDVHMPHVDGLSLLDQISKACSHEVRFIVVTGDCDDDIADTARLRGADDVVIKPFSVADVLIRVRSVLAG
jgi:putative two-component system response regulator